MSTETNDFQTKNSTQNQQDVNEIIKINFEKYFQEVEKIMPQYLQSLTKLQEEFLGAWKNTVNSSIDFQKKYAKKTDIETNIPKEAVDMIHKVAEEYIKSKNLQNQIILSALDVVNNNLKNHNNSFDSFLEINNQFLNFWVNFYSKKTNSE